MLGESDGAFSWWHLVRVRLMAIGGARLRLSVAGRDAGAGAAADRVALDRHYRPLLSPLLAAVETAWSWGVMAVLFGLLIRWLPNTRLPMRHAFAGGAVAAALFMVGRYGISLHIATTATRSALQCRGLVAALLVWVYWSSQIFLLGASLAVELEAPGGARAASDGPAHAD